jgi:hypothetical protein
MLDFDYVDWGDPDDPHGIVRHIEAAGLSPEEVESVLYSPLVTHGTSATTGRPVVYGTTDTGKFIVVIYEISKSGGIVVLEPVTAYEVAISD